MRLLLDTHAFLWFIFADPRLSTDAAEIIGDPAHERLLSIASIWEIAIKVKLGRLVLPNPLDDFLSSQMSLNDIQLLPIEFLHAVGVHSLSYRRLANGTDHKDPFDRMIVSQALAERLPVVSREVILGEYGVTRIW